MKLPYRLNEAAFLAMHGKWDIASLRMSPHWLVEQVKFIWHIQDIAQKADERKSKNSNKPKSQSKGHTL